MNWNNIVIFIKYIVATYILLVIFLAPVWLARQAKVTKTGMIFTRILSWIFGWTGIGWLLGLFISSRKPPIE